MGDALRHRGPDDSGYYEDGRVSMGMRRLAIVDLISGGQPIANEDESVWTVFNGEIYNHRDLRADLIKRGHRFRTDHSDTETIVHLYEEYGAAWPGTSRANGMFGLAIRDVKHRRLLLYRDRAGKKPLYYATLGKELVFGSEIKALLAHPGVSRELDYRSLARYFGLKHMASPDTAYAAVKQLPPGCLLVWDEDAGARVERYFSPDFSPLASPPDFEDAAGAVLDLLEDAVRLRMDCDAPYGAYLSGGLDSGAVVTLMRRFASHRIKTFSLVYEDEFVGDFAGKSDDQRFARMLSERLETEHHEYVMTPDDVRRRLPEVLGAFDEPFSGTISTFFLTELIGRHVKVAISGDGSDELFASYLGPRLAGPMDRYLRLAAEGKAALSDMSEAERRSLAPFDQEGFDFLRRVASPDPGAWKAALAVFGREEMDRLFSPAFLERAGGAFSGDVFARLGAGLTARDPVNRALEMDFLELLPNEVLPFVDRLSMAHSVEVRCPFLDHRLMEYVNRLPGDYKIREGVNKALLKRAMRGVLPDEVIDRPKEGFVLPVWTWMRTRMPDWVEEVLSPERTAVHGLWNPGHVRGLLDALFAGDRFSAAKVWNLLCFQIWWEGYAA